MIRYVDLSHQSEWKLGLLMSSSDKTWSVVLVVIAVLTSKLLPYTVERSQASVPESSYMTRQFNPCFPMSLYLVIERYMLRSQLSSRVINSSTNAYFAGIFVSKFPETPNKTELKMSGVDPGSAKTFFPALFGPLHGLALRPASY